MQHRILDGLGIFSITLLALASCGSDDSAPPASSGGTGGAAEAGPSEDAAATPFDTDYDMSGNTSLAAVHLAAEVAWVMTDGPVADDKVASRAVNYECGQSSVGTCPTLSVTCQAGQFLNATLVYGPSDGCTDDSGAPLDGTVVFTRNGALDWLVQFDSWKRGPLAIDGNVQFTSAVGQPWAMSLAGLQFTGALNETADLPGSCDKACVDSISYEVAYDLTLSTTTPITVDVKLVSPRSASLSGSVELSGTVTGSATLDVKDALGNPEPAEYPIDATYANQGVTLDEITYGLPRACTCPASGSLKTASAIDCGNVTATFKTASGATPCSTVVVQYSQASTLCTGLASTTKASIESRCVPTN